MRVASDAPAGDGGPGARDGQHVRKFMLPVLCEHRTHDDSQSCASQVHDVLLNAVWHLQYDHVILAQAVGQQDAAQARDFLVEMCVAQTARLTVGEIRSVERVGDRRPATVKGHVATKYVIHCLCAPPAAGRVVIDLALRHQDQPCLHRASQTLALLDPF